MQNKKSLLRYIVSLEYFFMAVVIGAFYFTVTDFAWYWLFVMFFIYELSLLGYTVGNKTGAWLYNAAHTIVGPALLAAIYIATNNQIALFIATTWLFHICVNRAMGYGMKHRAGNVEDTHLGKAKAHKRVARKKK